MLVAAAEDGGDDGRAGWWCRWPWGVSIGEGDDDVWAGSLAVDGREAMAQVGAAGAGEGCVAGAAQLLDGVHRRVHAVEGEAGAGDAECEEDGVDLAEGAGEELVVDTG